MNRKFLSILLVALLGLTGCGGHKVSYRPVELKAQPVQSKTQDDIAVSARCLTDAETTHYFGEEVDFAKGRKIVPVQIAVKNDRPTGQRVIVNAENVQVAVVPEHVILERGSFPPGNSTLTNVVGLPLAYAGAGFGTCIIASVLSSSQAWKFFAGWQVAIPLTLITGLLWWLAIELSIPGPGHKFKSDIRRKTLKELSVLPGKSETRLIFVYEDELPASLDVVVRTCAKKRRNDQMVAFHVPVQK